jgi:hypothetical protein
MFWHCLQIVEDEDEGSDSPEHAARSSCWAGQGGSSSDAALRQPLLQKLAKPWRQQKPKVCCAKYVSNNRGAYISMKEHMSAESCCRRIR